MGACIARCWPLIADPRYHPVRGRYFIQDDTVQARQPRRLSSLTSSSDDSLCMNENTLPDGGLRAASLQEAASQEDDLPLSLTPAVSLSPGRTYSLPLLPPSPPLLTGSPPSTPLPTDSASSTPLPASPPPSPLVGLFPCQTQYYNLTSKAEDEVELTPHLEPQDASDPPTVRPSSRVAPMNGGEPRWWGINRVPGSLPSLTEPDSPPTTSIDLEWEPEAGLARNSRDSLGGEEEASQTAESSSWVQRSSSSTPNSLEWDFRASTLSLRGGLEDETWHHTDMETEQLLQEIEQLAARALADTGHGLQPPPR
ncbi:merozoite surface protein CMZ-8-like isoform X2 [Procambarus clarkii]|uniref:merozoite surface protein CMZ-8-like isoform X2 n=1 Tax=Procambarus clarkii TaxID=6728 RepID=UPI003741F8DC